MNRQGATYPRTPAAKSQAWEQKNASRSARSRRAIGGPEAEAPVRAALVARVRREIADGTYDTPEKLEAALDRLVARLNLD